MHWQADRSRRRRSANADILESYGLPSTSSYNDMKSLHDGPYRSDCSGGCLRVAVAAATAAGASIVRAFSSSTLRWSQKMAVPAGCRKRQIRKKPFSKNACWLCESETESLREHEKDGNLFFTYEYPDAKPTTRGELPVLAVSPSHWLGQRGGYTACD